MQNNFKIYDQFTDEQIRKTLDIEHAEFKDIPQISFELVKSWIDKNPETHTIIVNGDEYVGCINFVPLDPAFYERYRSGVVSDCDIKAGNILSYKNGESYDFLFMNIIIKKEYRDGEAIKVLMSGFFDKLKKLQNRGITIRRVLANIVTADGENFLKRYGFEKIGKSIDGDLYETEKFTFHT